MANHGSFFCSNIWFIFDDSYQFTSIYVNWKSIYVIYVIYVNYVIYVIYVNYVNYVNDVNNVIYVIYVTYVNLKSIYVNLC